MGSVLLIFCHPRVFLSPIKALEEGYAPDRFSRGDSFHNITIQIQPFRIVLFNQCNLPGPIPLLKLLFPRYRAVYIFSHFKVNKVMDMIFACKTFCQIMLMLVNPSNPTTPLKILTSSRLHGLIIYCQLFLSFPQYLSGNTVFFKPYPRFKHSGMTGIFL